MKNFICLVIFFVGIVNHSFSQSKKKQIEALNHRLDSVMWVVQNERETNSQKVSTLELKIGQLNGEISNMHETIRQNERIIDKKDKTIQEAQKTINALKDSMSTLQMELTKLKPAPIEEVKESISIVEQSGNYKTVTIGSQVWMKENLNVSNFRNGDPIPQAKTDEEWVKAKENQQPAWCYYDNDPANGAKYGRLYNWYAVNDSRGLAPVGYHIPSDAEWTKLTDFLGGEGYAGIKMKSTNGWKNDDNGTNKSGFSGLPGGVRTSSGSFDFIGEYGYWWCSSEYDTSFAWYRYLDYGFGFVGRDYGSKEGGLSVRCLRD